MGKFIITKSEKSGDFYFNLKAGNGEIILTSQGYSSKDACENGIESVRTNSQSLSRFEKKDAKNGQVFFNLKAANGQVIGTSELYKSTAGRDNGMDSVKRNAPAATIEDLSK